MAQEHTALRFNHSAQHMADYLIRNCAWLDLFICCLLLFGATPILSEPVQSNILITASIVDGKGSETRAVERGDELELRVHFTAPAQGDVPLSVHGREYPLDRATLFRDADMAPKRIEAVLWLDPRHFSLYSNRHGQFDVDPRRLAHPHIVLAHPAPGEGSATANLRLVVRREAPLSETSIVGVLLFNEGELIADLSLPLRILMKGEPAPGATIIDSPFRPPARSYSDDGVLTLIEIHPKLVQLTFACSSGIKSWRVADERHLQDWPKYVDEGIQDDEIEFASVAATFRNVLFPRGERCEAGNCAAAASLFDSWARRAVDARTPPALKVQALPLGKDSLYAPVLMPVGVLPIHVGQEEEDLLLPEEQPDRQNQERLGSPMEEAILDPALQPELTTANVSISVLDVDASTDESGSPIEGDLAISDSRDSVALDMQLDPVAPETLRDRSSVPLDDLRLLADLEDPTQLELRMIQGLDTLLDPISSPPEVGYLAYYAVVNAPLHRAKVVPANSACAKAWTIMLPQAVDDPGLRLALEHMRALLDIWHPVNWKADWSQVPFRFERSLDPLKRRERRGAIPSDTWLIVSHYNSRFGALRMPRADGKPQSVAAAELRSNIAPPGVVLLLACQTAVPAIHDFLPRLIENGAATLISTDALLPGNVAGDFATIFIGVIGEAGPTGITVAEAFWESLKRLPLQEYVPRFVLAGDPGARLCAPPLVR